MTAIFQLLTVVACAFGFAKYVLWRDKKEQSPKARIDDAQQSIYFPEHRPDEERDQRGAAMSRLQ